jgi:phytoene dehydrogenase-like protein
MRSNSITITVIGGGLAGLVAAISARESGASVDLHETHTHLGGRARSSAPPYVANLGPHAIYADGPLWRWLDDRALVSGSTRPPKRGIFLRHSGSLHRIPPPALLRGIALVRRRDVPTDTSFYQWADSKAGPKVAEVLCRFTAVGTFTHDPGAVSAAFGAGVARRVTTFPPAARYVPGGWTTLAERLGKRAVDMGVRVHLGSPVTELPGSGPVIVATELSAARRLLGDDSLTWPSGRVVSLDLGIEARRGDPFIISDLDGPGWVECFSYPDPSLAPQGHRLVQVQVGVRPDESLADGVGRAEALMDLGYRGWRDRERWRRRSLLDGRSGALDYPGTSVHDRPAIERGNDVFLCGDSVAAPGLLGEVSWSSAIAAAEGALRAVGREVVLRSPA